MYPSSNFKTTAWVTGGLFLLIAASSCSSKYDCTPDPIDPVQEKGATIKEGSYFIYIDSLSNTRDSFGVYRFNDNVFCDDKRRNKSHYLDYYMGNATGTTLYLRTGPGIYGLFGSFKTTWFLFEPFKADEILNGNSPSDSLFSARQVQKYTSITIRNRTYNQVYEILNKRISADKSDTEYVHTFYSSESGLVKFRTRLNQEGWKIWELEQSNIVR